jgi:hypothetical protein
LQVNSADDASVSLKVFHHELGKTPDHAAPAAVLAPYEKFSAHEIGTVGWVKSIPFEEIKRNVLLLAQAARILKLPVVLTSSLRKAGLTSSLRKAGLSGSLRS